jgi:integrase
MEAAIDKDLHNNIDTYTAQTTTLNDRYDMYIESKINLRRSTKRNYIYMYDKYVRDTVGQMKMCDIKYSIIQRLYNNMITKYGFQPNSMEALHTVLNPVFERAMWDNIIDSNPCPKAMKQIRESDAWVKDKKRALTLEEQKAFMNFLRTSPKYRHWTNIMVVLLGTGMRIGELLALTVGDVDFENRIISITKSYQRIDRRDVITEPKTPKSNRIVEMPEFLVEEIKDYVGTLYDLRPNDRLFPLSKSYLYRKMEQGSKEMGLQRIRVHDLRHSHVSLLIHMGYSAVAIAERMGHESIDITFRYAHLFPTVQRQMAADLNALQEGGDENVC